MDTLTLLIAVLATYRLTRLVTTDRITEAPRNWIIRKLPRESLISYWLVCDWCASIYTGVIVAGAWWEWGGTEVYTVATLTLALSSATGFLTRLESE